MPGGPEGDEPSRHAVFGYPAPIDAAHSRCTSHTRSPTSHHQGESVHQKRFASVTSQAEYPSRPLAHRRSAVRRSHRVSGRNGEGTERAAPVPQEDSDGSGNPGLDN